MTQTLNDLYLSLRRRLRDAGIEASELEAREIAACAAGADKQKTTNWAYEFLTEETAVRAQELASKRLAGEPLAYLLGEWDFYGLTFTVKNDVLIPRPDTERLCELAIAAANQIDNPRVLDLCCGSGCIGIALLHEVKSARVTAGDISQEALSIARENARRHGVTSRFAAVQMDMRKPPDIRLGQFDLLLCNPPYITAQEMQELDPGVRDYEPLIALFGGADGLDFYRAAASQWGVVLDSRGQAFFECGWKQGHTVATLLENAGWRDTCIYRDYAGIERVVSAYAPDNNITGTNICCKTHTSTI